MNKRKMMAVISVILAVGSILVFMGNGCSGQFQVDPSSIGPSGSNHSQGAQSAATDEDLVPGTKTVSVVYAKQALDQLSACAGVISPSDATQSMYENKKGAISVYGTAETITSPMMMAVISIAGELCNDLINQEKDLANKRIFKGWDLKSNSLPSTGLINESITRLALSCWQKQESSSERQQVSDAVFSVSQGEANASSKAALMLCTSMLSSLNSLLN